MVSVYRKDLTEINSTLQGVCALLSMECCIQDCGASKVLTHHRQQKVLMMLTVALRLSSGLIVKHALVRYTYIVYCQPNEKNYLCPFCRQT